MSLGLRKRRGEEKRIVWLEGGLHMSLWLRSRAKRLSFTHIHSSTHYYQPAVFNVCKSLHALSKDEASLIHASLSLLRAMAESGGIGMEVGGRGDKSEGLRWRRK